MQCNHVTKMGTDKIMRISHSYRCAVRITLHSNLMDDVSRYFCPFMKGHLPHLLMCTLTPILLETDLEAAEI